MAIRYVAPTGGIASGTASTPETAWTPAHANANLVPGDEVAYLSGTVTVAPNPTNSGTSTNRITFQPDTGATVTIADDMPLVAKSWLSFIGLTFSSTGSAWVTADVNCDRLTFDGCTFTSVGTSTDGWTFWGIRIRGDHNVIKNCTFENWPGGDTIQIYGDYCRIAFNDFNKSDSGHGPIMNYGQYTVIRSNYIRSKWARAGHTLSDVGEQGLGVLFIDNTIFDTGLTERGSDPSDNDGYPVYGWSLNTTNNPEGPGDHQIYKPGGTGTIHRNNAWIATNSGWQTTPQNYTCVHQIGNFDQDHPYWQHMRFQHETYYDNAGHAFSVTYNASNDYFPNDNRWTNCVIHQNGTLFNTSDVEEPHSFFMAPNNLNWLQTYHWHKNIITDRIRYGGSTYTTMAAFEAAIGSRATGNIDTAPTFVNPDYSAAHANRDLFIDRANFTLAPGSVGKAAADPLATVTANSTGTTLTVSDAYQFYPGYGVEDEPGDTIIVNGQTTQVTARLNATQLTISPAISATIGDEVWLAAYGVSPDIGMFVEADEPPPAIELAATLLDTVSNTTVTTTVTSGTLSPDDNALLVIVASANNNTSGALVTPMSISDTFSGTQTWTKVETNRGSGAGVGIAIFTAQLGASPGTGTVTVTFANNATGKVLHSIQVVGQDTAAPVVQNATNATSNSTPFVITLPGTPATDSMVLAAVATRGNGTLAATEGAGFTQLAETVVTTTHMQAVQYDIDSADTTADWTGTFGGSGIAGVAIEIAAAEVAEPFTATGSGTLAPLDAFAFAEFTPPSRTATGTVNVPVLTASGSASFDAGTYTAAGQATSPALDATGQATSTDPVFDATGAVTLSAPTAIGLADHTAPTFSASGSSSLGTLTGEGLAEFSTVVFDSNGAPSLPSLDATGSADHTAPIFEAMGASTLAPLNATGEADVTDPFFQATGTPSLSALTASGLAEFNTVVRTGSGAPNLASLGATGNGQTHVPIFDGTGTPSMGSLSASGSASLILPTRESTGAITLPLFSASGEASYIAPIRTATGALVLSVVTAAGVVDYTPPVIYTATGSGTMPALGAFAFGFADDPLPTPPPRIIVRATVEI